MINLPTNQQVSLRVALEIVPYFDGSSKVPLTIFIEVCKEAKEIVPNAEGKEKGQQGRFLGQTPIVLEVRGFSLISESHNSLQGFFSKSDFIKRN